MLVSSQYDYTYETPPILQAMQLKYGEDETSIIITDPLFFSWGCSKRKTNFRDTLTDGGCRPYPEYRCISEV